jgi:xanthine/uracil permease
MSFSSPKVLKRVFPPIVTGLLATIYVTHKTYPRPDILSGTVILMIGASLIGSSGIVNWGGGSNDCQSRPATGIFALCPTIFAPRPLPCVHSFRACCSRFNISVLLLVGVLRNLLD